MKAESEALIILVGFLGAGKTTLLKKMVKSALQQNLNPSVILNDYQNANLDVQLIKNEIENLDISSLTGSCICCSGIADLRNKVNEIPQRKDGITFIEANGTSDACVLMEFLGVGINKRFAPPIQISVVSAKDWQKRGANNELESNQIQVSSLILLTHLMDVDAERVGQVSAEIKELNPYAKIAHASEWDIEDLIKMSPVKNIPKSLDHLKSHWASCSVDLPDPITSESLERILNQIPSSVLRVKGSTRLDDDEHYTYFERIPNGETSMRPYYGKPFTGPKLLSVGPGSDPELLKKLIDNQGSISQ